MKKRKWKNRYTLAIRPRTPRNEWLLDPEKNRNYKSLADLEKELAMLPKDEREAVERLLQRPHDTSTITRRKILGECINFVKMELACQLPCCAGKSRAERLQEI